MARNSSCSVETRHLKTSPTAGKESAIRNSPTSTADSILVRLRVTESFIASTANRETLCKSQTPPSPSLRSKRCTTRPPLLRPLQREAPRQERPPLLVRSCDQTPFESRERSANSRQSQLK